MCSGLEPSAAAASISARRPKLWLRRCHSEWAWSETRLERWQLGGGRILRKMATLGQRSISRIEDSVDRMVGALGPPQELRMLGSGGGLLAAIGRWRHGGVCLGPNKADPFRLVFNVSGGQVVDLEAEGRSLRTSICEGSLGVISPDQPMRVRVSGRADILQFFLSPALLDRSPRQPSAREPQLQAAAAQALVALRRNGAGDDVELESIVQRVASRLRGPRKAPTGQVQGGLAPGARRRVQALLEAWMRDARTAPSLGDLAAAAGLSVHHFSRMFRTTEGTTPYARVAAWRMDAALTLLLRAEARIDWISDATGFSSPSHFVSAFRRHVGVTPGALRDAVHG